LVADRADVGMVAVVDSQGNTVNDLSTLTVVSVELFRTAGILITDPKTVTATVGYDVRLKVDRDVVAIVTVVGLNENP